METVQNEIKSKKKPKELCQITNSLWHLEGKIKALAILFKNFDGHGSVIEDAEDLAGIGEFLGEISTALKNDIDAIDDNIMLLKI